MARGPRKSEINHQLNPLLPLACAKPALMSERVNHPTAYSPAFEFMFSLVLFVASLLAQGSQHVDYKRRFGFQRLNAWPLFYEKRERMGSLGRGMKGFLG